MPRIRLEHVPVSLVAFMLYITETGGVLTIRQWKRRPDPPPPPPTTKKKTNQNKKLPRILLNFFAIIPSCKLIKTTEICLELKGGDYVLIQIEIIKFIPMPFPFLR